MKNIISVHYMYIDMIYLVAGMKNIISILEIFQNFLVGAHQESAQ